MTSPLVDALQPMLTGRFGRAIRHFEVVDSTSSEALRWVADEADPAPDGALVLADLQTEGRGRWGREWFGEPGSSLMFSLVLRPMLPADRIDLITTVAGVAVTEAVREAGADASLKWPNDVIVRERKLAGVLAESRTRADRVEAVVLGIGVNLSIEGSAAPEEIARRAVGLAEAAPDPIEPHVLLARILARLERYYDALWTDAGPGEIVTLAEKRSSIVGREVVVTFPDGSKQEGRAIRIAHDGSLELDLQGERRSVRSGEITTVRPAGVR